MNIPKLDEIQNMIPKKRGRKPKNWDPEKEE